MSTGPTFKPEEDAVIRELYPDYAAILGRLPTRSRLSIKKRASKIGASASRSTSLRKWTDDEDSKIRSLYPNYEAIYMHMPHRTRYAVKRRAADLGVCAGRCGGSDPDARPWTDEERALAAKWGAEIPGRSRFALVAFRNRNGIKVRRDTKPEARGRQQRTPKPRTPRPIPPPRVILPPVPKPVAWKRQGNEISPRVIAAAARSRHGIELIATVQRAVPRDVWPHLRPLVIEQVALGVMERRIDLSDLAGAVKTTAAALVAQQFSGAA